MILRIMKDLEVKKKFEKIFDDASKAAKIYAKYKEECIFIEYVNSYALFGHTSSYRKNHRINLELSIAREKYESNSAIIDKKQLDELSLFCEINIRE